MKLEKLISKILEKHRLDTTIKAMLEEVPWDDLLLAFSNICVYQADKVDKKLESKIWYDRAKLLHKVIDPSKKPSVQPRKRKIKDELLLG